MIVHAYPAHKRLRLWLWSVLPAAITLLFLVAYLVPKRVSGLDSFMPVLPMLPIFYWGLNHAPHMPYWFVFAVGLLVDAVTGQPLGMSSLLNVFFLLMVRTQHKYIHKEGFVIKWGYFAMLLGAVCLAHGMIMFAYAGVWGIKFMIIQWFLTVCCYPLFHQLFDTLHHHATQQRWHLLHTR